MATRCGGGLLRLDSASVDAMGQRQVAVVIAGNDDWLIGKPLLQCPGHVHQVPGAEGGNVCNTQRLNKRPVVA